MAVLSFKVQADYEKVVRLREEIARLETQLRSFGRNTPLNEIKAVEARLAEAKQEFTAITTEAAKAGAVIESDFKNKIRSASSAVNDFTAKIIEQKSVVKDVEHDVKRLAEAYQKALKSDSSNAPSIKADYDAAKKALQEEKAALFGLTQEKAKASLETKKLKDEYAAFKEEAGEAVKANEGFTMSLGKIAGLVGGVTVLKQLAAQVVRVRGEFQDMETAIETLVGKDMAGKLMPQIKEMAKISPLTMTDIVGAEKTMLGFNIEAEKTIDYLKAISDISMGNSQKFNSLTLAFSQMSAAGRLLGQDLNQMVAQGFNPLQIISEKTGKSIAQLKEEMSKGAISAEMVQQAFLDATSAGGKFYNMSENASKTINGQISMMQDAMDAAFNEIGTKTEGIIINSIKAATSLIQNYEKIGKVLVGLVATYGVYRTAVIAATAAEKGLTVAELALTKARVLAKKAQDALNASMLSNPYVALAVVVAGLVASMWALRDSTSAAEKAQKRFNDIKEKAAQKEQEHKNVIQGLIDKVRDETQANADRITAMKALQNEYPNIFKHYDIEKMKLADILEIQKQINEEDAIRRRQSAAASIAGQEGRIKAYDAMRQSPAWGGRNMFASDKDYDKEVELLKQMRDDYLMTYSLPDFAKTLKGKTEEQLNEVLNALKQTNYFDGATYTDAMLGELKMADIKSVYPDFYKALGDAVNTELQSRQPSGIDYATAKKEWDDAKQALVDIEKDKDKFTDEQRQAAIDRKKKAGDAYKGFSFSAEYEVAEEEWKDAKKALEAIEKDKDRFTTEQYKAAETRKDTAEKNFKKLGGDTTGKTEKNAVKEYNDNLAAQEKVQQAQEKSDRERARTAEDMEMMVQQARISAMKNGQEKRRAQRDLNHRKELQSLERQKQDYIAQAVAQEKAIFDAQEEQKSKNDKNYKKQTFDTSAAQKRIETTDPVVNQYTQVITYTEQKQKQESTKEDMTAWRDSMNAYLREYGTYEAKKLAITKEYEAKIAEASNIWEKGALQQKMKEELAALDIEANKTTNAIAQLFGDMRDKTVKELDGIAEKGKEALEFLKGGEWDESKGKELGITKETFEIWSKSPEKLKAIAEALEKVRKAAEDVRNPLGKIVDGFKDLFDSAGDKNKFKEAFSLISEGVGEVTNAIGFVSDSLASMGEALGSEGLMKAADAINSALNVADQTMQGAQAGAAFGPWGAAIGAAVGLASSLVTEISKAKDAIRDAEIERLAKEVETLDKTYDSLGKSIEKAFSADASKLIEQQNTLLEQKKANLQLMIAEEQAKKSVDENILAEYQARLDEIDAMIDSNKDKAVDAIVGQDVMSAIDSFASAYADAWTSGADAAEASTKAVKNMIRTSLLEFLKGQLSDEVEAFNKRLAEAMKDGIIDPWEEEQLNALREKMDAEAQNYYDKTSQYWGDDEDESESQQTASRKGYETLSEDTGNELVGRALAQYESNLRMEEATRSMKDSVDLMAANQVQIRDIAADARSLIASSYAELQQISANTGAIIKPIGAIKVAIEEMNKKIDQL